MYGTIARMKIKPGGLEALNKMDQRRPPGFEGTLIYRMDADPNEIFMVVLFEDKESYLANAQSPEQHQEYMMVRERLAADPEWHDGQIVYDNR